MSETRQGGVVLIISGLVLWICFGLRVSDFGFMPAQEGGTAKIRPDWRSVALLACTPTGTCDSVVLELSSQSEE
jgi:hypothetical protein